MESKSSATDRLRHEGRWEEASEFKDTLIVNLRDYGMKGTDAREAAWEVMIEKYPPILAVEVSESSSDEQLPDIGDDALERFSNTSHNLTRDILWVYESLEDKRIQIEDAPSLGAWSLLRWARDYRNRFFEQLLPKALASKKDEIGASKTVYDVDPDLREIERLLRQVKGAANG